LDVCALQRIIRINNPTARHLIINSLAYLRKKVFAICPLIPENIVEEIKNRNELVSVVEQYVTLDRKSSSNYFGLCPFHQEDTPSFSVSPSKQIFYCFGCHKGGNVITFVKEIEHVSYPQALQILADRAGIELPEPDDEAWKQKSERNKKLHEILLEAARWYYHQLTDQTGLSAQNYLRRREITAATAKKFGLGYAPDNWDGLLIYLQKKGYSQDELLMSGLFKKTQRGNLIDLFRGRLIFPIFDVLGRVVAFGGRVLDDSLPKYINSPETPIYTKGRHLYALNLAKSSRSSNLVIVEGYLDAIAMHQAGVDQAVAALGTALTDQQAVLLRKYTEDVIIGFDADSAGQQAALRGLDILAGKGMNVSVLIVPDGKDPDEYIRKNGPERFKALLEKALPLLDFRLRCAKMANEMEGKLDIIGYQDQACDILAEQENVIVRELYADKLAETLHTSKESVIKEIERRIAAPGSDKKGDQLRQQLKQKQQELTRRQEQNNDQITREEIYLLVLLASYPECWQQMNEKPTPADFSSGTIRQLFIEALPLISEGKLDSSRLLDLAGDIVIQGRELKEILAKGSMQIDELLNNQPAAIAARQWLMRSRMNQIKLLKQKLEQELTNCEEQSKVHELRQKLLRISQEYAELREKFSSII
jgi:DNA primase